MQDESQPFQYEPLETSTTIRLVYVQLAIELSPGKKVEARVLHADLNNPDLPEYIAVSYVWGEPARKHSIHVNGREFKVTESVFEFLTRPRPYVLACEPLAYWIDQICIDQSNLDEKARQIPLMTRIYQNSIYVLADLGHAAEEQAAALSYVTTIALRKTDEQWDQILQASRGEASKAAVSELRIPYILPLDHVFWKLLVQLLEHPYWSRVWIMQEATALSNTKIAYGSKMTSLGNLRCADAIQLLATQGLIPDAAHLELWRLGNLARIFKIGVRRLGGSNEPWRLLDVLEEFRGLDCTDHRDIVYAAMNLATDLRVVPDYSQPVSSVFCSVAAHYMQTLDHPLDIFGSCGTNETDSQFADGFPSWCPRWTEPLPTAQFPKQYTNAASSMPARCYNACNGADILTEGKVEMPQIKGTCLQLRGFEVDEIVTIKATAVAANDFEIKQIIAKWAPKDGSTLYVTRLESKMQAFLRTLVADLDLEWITMSPRARGGAAAWDHQRGELFHEAGLTSTVASGRFSARRRLAETKQGHFALVTQRTRPGDRIFLLYGGSMVYVLRPSGDEYRLVCESYVHGLMDGEAMAMLKDGRATLRNICII